MNGKGTLYEKIASDYVQAIKHGAYSLHSRLPSVRETAAFYQCNPSIASLLQDYDEDTIIKEIKRQCGSK